MSFDSEREKDFELKAQSFLRAGECYILIQMFRLEDRVIKIEEKLDEFVRLLKERP